MAAPNQSDRLLPPDGSVRFHDTRPDREKRRLWGRSLRDALPRAEQAAMAPRRADRDPLALIEQSNRGRLEHLLPLRTERMLESPLAFLRGTAILQADDLGHAPSAGIVVPSCGDCHLQNFGIFASPERTLLFDINDFDESLPAPFEWDVKRLAASFAVAARGMKCSASDVRQTAQTMVAAYREHVGRFADMKTLDVWYARLSLADLLHDYAGDAEMTKRIQKRIEEAKGRTSDAEFQKRTKMVNGRPRIVDDPPLLKHVAPESLDLKRDIDPFFDAYRQTLQPDRRALMSRYELVDVVLKVVGVGSVGTRSYVTLWMADRDDPLFLQLKEAGPSVLEGRAGPSPYAHNGERVVSGQRLMQSASDIFLGWARLGDHDYYVRQLRDHKAAADLDSMGPRILVQYAAICGRVLARAHAKSGEAPAIRGYVGSSPRFDEAIAEYAVGYAGQVEWDYELFCGAVKKGRFPVGGDSLR